MVKAHTPDATRHLYTSRASPLPHLAGRRLADAARVVRAHRLAVVLVAQSATEDRRREQRVHRLAVIAVLVPANNKFLYRSHKDI